jgi:glycosyltransferase involved in cell wall biosynthesis
LNLSIVIPAKNEAQGLARILPDIVRLHPDAELIVVNDGSTDDTADVASRCGAKVITHPYAKGNGASIKSGARVATGDMIVFMDGDGQHKPEDIARLIQQMAKGFDMVVGARSATSQASVARWFGNGLYNRLASMMVGHKIADLTSGFRIVRAGLFKEFLYLLPNGFSYPTTITMAFFRAGYSVDYMDIVAEKRLGKSHMKIVRDGIRFFLIIFKIATLYSPLKLFLPVSVIFFLMGSCYYSYTYIMASRFTNMSLLLFITSLLVFLMGLISEQITALVYKHE